ncbi:MAG: universal stress protein [Proteobacteria bacterium]|nr:universal stress protein [Pseudomonadota bacterium]
MFRAAKILVPTDFSACSRLALDYALFFAEHLGSQIDLLHVWEPPRYVIPEVTVQLPGEVRQSLASFARAAAGKEMNELLALLAAPDHVQVRGRLESGDPTETVVELAAREGFELVVMGTHGRTGLSHVFLGSVAEKIVRRASCPVLTIRHSGGEQTGLRSSERPE